MSDPLSIAGSIAGLAQLTAVVFHALIRYARDVKHARSDVGQLATEVRILSGMFQSLSLFAASFIGDRRRKWRKGGASSPRDLTTASLGIDNP